MTEIHIEPKKNDGYILILVYDKNRDFFWYYFGFNIYIYIEYTYLTSRCIKI